MHILSEINRNGKGFNALNDINPNGGHVMHISADTHLMFEWDNENGIWAYKPMKMTAHAPLYVTNTEIVVMFRFSEKADYKPQTTVSDMKNAHFAKKVLHIFDAVKNIPPPKSAKKLEKAILENNIRRVR